MPEPNTREPRMREPSLPEPRPIEEAGRRPLDRVASFKVKLGILVAASVLATALLMLIGLNLDLSPVLTVTAAVVLGLAVTQFLARGMTSPLREMTAAAVAMSRGDYSRTITATSRDEIGELARAFTTMSRELENTDSMRRELVANVSHELRTPVAALQAQLENIVDGVTEPDERSLAVALAQTERLSTLVAQLLDLSRLEAGVVPLTLEDLMLTPFLHEAVDGADLVARTSGRPVRFTVDVEPAGLTVRADPDRLHQVIANLLDNASRFSPPSGVVRISAHRREDRIEIDVVDQGPGIAPEHRERVFQRFHHGSQPGSEPGSQRGSQRSSQSGSDPGTQRGSQRGSQPGSPSGSQPGSGRSGGGTGLGLAIARWAVTLHDGQIFVVDDPRPDTGTTIRLVLPDHRPADGGM